MQGCLYKHLSVSSSYCYNIWWLSCGLVTILSLACKHVELRSCCWCVLRYVGRLVGINLSGVQEKVYQWKMVFKPWRSCVGKMSAYNAMAVIYCIFIFIWFTAYFVSSVKGKTFAVQLCHLLMTAVSTSQSKGWRMVLPKIRVLKNFSGIICILQSHFLSDSLCLRVLYFSKTVLESGFFLHVPSHLRILIFLWCHLEPQLFRRLWTEWILKF